VNPASDLGNLTVVEVALGHPDTVTAEHWLASLLVTPVLACTHLVRTPSPQVALTLGFDGELPDLPGSSPATLSRSSGRAVLYPGVEALTGTLTVADILTLSIIEHVEVLGSGPASPESLVDTDNFVRPQWRAGSLVLTTTPAAGGLLVPFETRNPTPCCAAH
jgi:hypothetical protein